MKKQIKEIKSISVRYEKCNRKYDLISECHYVYSQTKKQISCRSCVKILQKQHILNVEQTREILSECQQIKASLTQNKIVEMSSNSIFFNNITDPLKKLLQNSTEFQNNSNFDECNFLIVLQRESAIQTLFENHLLKQQIENASDNLKSIIKQYQNVFNEKKSNRPNLDSSANSSRSGSIQSRSQYLGRERGLDFSSLMIYIRKYNLTRAKMFQNKFGLDGDKEQDWDAIVERQITKLDPKDARLSMVQAMLSAFGEEINLSCLGLRQLDCTPIYISHNIDFKEQINIQTKFNTWLIKQEIKFKKQIFFLKNFKKFNQQLQKNNNPSQTQVKSDLIRNILEKQELTLNNISFKNRIRTSIGAVKGWKNGFHT